MAGTSTAFGGAGYTAKRTPIATGTQRDQKETAAK
jgi:hypothetical protein